MTRQYYLGVLSLAVSLTIAGLWFWNRPAKIAYAETSVILNQFGEAIKARKQFEESQKEWDKNLKDLNDSLMTAMERMKERYDKASSSDKDSLRIHLQRRNEDLQRYTNAVKKMSQEKEKELMDPVISKVNSFLDAWGKAHGYDLILGTMSGGNILQANSDLNVTSKVMKDINEHYKNLPAASEGPKTETSGDLAPRMIAGQGTKQ